MELALIEPAPVVTEHAAVFRDLFENQCQFRHFQHYLSGLIVLPNKSLANIARCTLESADKNQSLPLPVGSLLAGGRGESAPHPVYAPADETPSPLPP